MKLRDSQRTLPVDVAPRFARVLAAAAFFAAACSVVSCGGTKRAEVVKPSEKEGFVRVEDLPPAPKPGFVRVDELAPAAPVAVRPLKPKELTRELIRRADTLLKKDESKVGTQVLVEVGDKAYIARFEWHYQYDRLSDRPERWHKGVTLYTTE